MSDLLRRIQKLEVFANATTCECHKAPRGIRFENHLGEPLADLCARHADPPKFMCSVHGEVEPQIRVIRFVPGSARSTS